MFQKIFFLSGWMLLFLTLTISSSYSQEEVQHYEHRQEWVAAFDDQWQFIYVDDQGEHRRLDSFYGSHEPIIYNNTLYFRSEFFTNTPDPSHAHGITIEHNDRIVAIYHPDQSSKAQFYLGEEDMSNSEWRQGEAPEASDDVPSSEPQEESAPPEEEINQPDPTGSSEQQAITFFKQDPIYFTTGMPYLLNNVGYNYNNYKQGEILLSELRDTSLETIHQFRNNETYQAIQNQNSELANMYVQDAEAYLYALEEFVKDTHMNNESEFLTAWENMQAYINAARSLLEGE